MGHPVSVTDFLVFGKYDDSNKKKKKKKKKVNLVQ